MPQSIIDTMAVTQLPHMAFNTLAGAPVVLFTDDPEVARYTGRVVIHSGRYASGQDMKAGYEILKEAGWSEEDAPQVALIGYCRIKSGTTVEYDEQRFQKDRQLHGMPDMTLDAMLRRLNWQQAWGLKLQDPHWALEPIFKVRESPEESVQDGAFWLPDQPYQYEAFKMLVKKERSLPFKKALDVLYPAES